MKRFVLIFVLFLTAGMMSGCGQVTEETAPEPAEAAVATPAEAAAVELDLEGLVPVTADKLTDGVYNIQVDSSSAMFNIESCTLTVAEGEMTALLTMSGTGYLCIFPGTAEEAAAASEEDYIPFIENADGAHTYTFPVAALDQGLDCAAFSKRKALWYDRTLVFRANTLPVEAFREGVVKTAESLGLADGDYTVAVTLEGGSGRAAVVSPTTIAVENGRVTARIAWNSAKYDYMKVNGEMYLPVNTEGNSVFEIPVAGFDFPLAVLGDTTAMSTPHEIEYTLTFDASTLQAQETAP